MAETNHCRDEYSIYRYFSRGVLAYGLMRSLHQAAVAAKVLRRMEPNDAERFTDCINRALDEASELAIADLYGLAGDPSTNFEPN